MYTKWTSWKEDSSPIWDRDMLIAPRAIVLPEVTLQELRCALRHLHRISAAEKLGDGSVVFAVPQNRAAAFEALPNFVPAYKYAVKQSVSRHEIGAVETFRFVSIPGYVDSGEGAVTAFISGQFTPQRAGGYDEFVEMLSVALCAATGQPHRSVFTPIQP